MVKRFFIGMALAGLALFPSAASAQVSFGFHFGDEPRDFAPKLPMCLTDSQIREAIAQRGFTDISLNVPNGRKIQVRATHDGWVYLIDFDFCGNDIRGVKPLRPAQ